MNFFFFYFIELLMEVCFVYRTCCKTYLVAVFYCFFSRFTQDFQTLAGTAERSGDVFKACNTVAFGEGQEADRGVLRESSGATRLGWGEGGRL